MIFHILINCYDIEIYLIIKKIKTNQHQRIFHDNLKTREIDFYKYKHHPHVNKKRGTINFINHV
jgi:hypothetical protein